MGEEKKGARFSRRSFLKSIGGGALGTAVVSTGLIKTDDAAAYVPETVGVGRGKTAVALKVNGKTYRVQVEHRQTLAEVLRDELGLTGTKIGCDAGDCGACTVLLDGAQVCACLVAAGQAAGRRVVTVEGLARNGRLSTLQQAFHLYGAAQCGICTPGMLMAASDLLQRNPRPSEAEALDALGGVLCRCTGYRKIVDAVLHLGEAAAVDGAPAGAAVGARLAKVDGAVKLDGSE